MSKAKKTSESVNGSRTELKVRTIEAAEKVSQNEGVQAVQELPAGQQQAVAQIGHIYTALCKATRTTVAKAIELGEHLTELRKQISHGHWGRFIKAHLPFNERTVERYMRLYQHRAALADKTDTVSELFLSQAYALVSKSKAVKTAAATAEEPATSSGDDQSRQRVKDEILTGIQRGLVDGLEKLEPVLLEAFERDLLAFKNNWLSEHQRRQGEVLK